MNPNTNKQLRNEVDEMIGAFSFYNPEKAERLKAALNKLEVEADKNVDRFEVIDDTGRAYVKGSIYGSPVTIERSYQDDNRTLKVFVKAHLNNQGED